MQSQNALMKHLTVRDVPADVAKALDRERRRRGLSLNETVKQLLRQSLALEAEKSRDNGLGKLAGTWSKAELSEFEAATAVFEKVDEHVWK